MIKRLTIFICVCILFILPVFAESELFSKNELDSIVPKEVSSLLPEGYSEDIYTFGIKDFSSKTESILSSLFPSVFLTVSRILSFVILSSVSSAVRKDITSPSLSGMLEFVSAICLCSLIYSVIDNLSKTAFAFMESLTIFVNSMLPYMTLLGISGGNALYAASNSSFMLFALAFFQDICVYALSPLIKICFAFVIAGSLSPDADLSGITNIIKKVYTFFLSGSTALLSIFLVLQTTISASADNVTARGIKFAGSFIPVVGSALGDAVRTVISSLSLIKNSVGYFAVIVLLLLMLPVFLNLVLSRLTFIVVKNLSDILGCRIESRLLEQSGGIINLLIAAVASSGVVFIIVFSLFIRMTYAAA